jgi:hypothetical protein
MKNFKLLKDKIDLSDIRQELRQSALWVNQDALVNRQATRAGTERIQLRTNKKIAGKHYHDIQETCDLEAWDTLLHTRNFVLEAASALDGEIGHVRVTSLRGGGEILPHIDVGEYCAIRDRYHLVIEASRGTEFVSGGERVVMREGEFWWFDNKQEHYVRNLGEMPRIHLIFDLLRHV